MTLKIVEQTQKEVVCSSQGRVFDENQWALLVHSESIVEPLVKSNLSSKKIIILMAKMNQNLLDKSFDKQGMENLDGT